MSFKLLRVCALLSAAWRCKAATCVFDAGSLSAGWTVSIAAPPSVSGAASPSSGNVTLSGAVAHASQKSTLQAGLAPFSRLVLRAPSDFVSNGDVQLSLFLAASAGDRTPVALSLSVASSLPSGGAKPVATLCVLSQASPGDAIVLANASGAWDAGACSLSLPDSTGWVLLSVALSQTAAAASGWDELSVTDQSGAGCSLSLDAVVLAAAADLANQALFQPSAQWCKATQASVFSACTLPPSDECCSLYQSFNSRGCYCIAEVVAAGGQDLQLASVLAQPDACSTSLALEDSPLCFLSGDVAGTPPLPGSPDDADRALPPAALRFSGARRRVAAADVAPYIGIVATTALVTALTWRLFVVRAADEMLRLGTAEWPPRQEERMLRQQW
jgi:hypothetical protein